MDKAWGMRARRAGAESTGCNCEESSGQQFCPNLCHSTYLARCICPPNLQRCPCARHPLCVLPCSCPLILGRSIGHRVRPVLHRPRGKCALCATTRRRVKGRRRRMRRPPCSLVRHACLELRRLMPAGGPCQVGAGLLGLIVSTFFPPCFLFPLMLPLSNATSIHSGTCTFCFLSYLVFFLSWVVETQPNHWTKRMASTRLAT